MTPEQAEFVKSKLAQIKALGERYERDRATLRKELIYCARWFDTYAEMYGFIRNNTPTLEDFNRDMLEAREVWFETQEKKNCSIVDTKE